MSGLVAAVIVGTIIPTSSPPADFLRVDGASDSMYVVRGSIVATERTTFVTLVTPLDEQGLMSVRIEMDCRARRYRPVVVSFYNLDGSPRSSTGSGDGPDAAPGWATRNAAEIAAVVCR